MPDISMCFGKDCPMKESCYRFTAKPNEYSQSYFQEPPFIQTESDEQPTCEYYWEIENKTKKP